MSDRQFKKVFDAELNKESNVFFKISLFSTITEILRAKAGNLNFWTPDLDKSLATALKEKIGAAYSHMPVVGDIDVYPRKNFQILKKYYFRENNFWFF